MVKQGKRDGAPPLAPPAGLSAVAAFEVEGEVLVVLRLCESTPTWERHVSGASAKPLTAAERDVALLAMRGLSNDRIARARGTSPRTVAVQLASVYEKLGIGSRAGLTTAVVAASSRASTAGCR
jgi:DNA-binding CsgD family transcriptional regulator